MLANFVKTIVTQNNLLDGYYVELYAGGAGIAWPLLFEEYVRHVYINDLNRSVYAFWKSVLEHTDSLCALIQDTPVTMQEWNRQKEIQATPKAHSILELGFSTFYLNRTNRSGIINGGVIGGKAQAGDWKLDARFNKQDLVLRIQRIARYRSRIGIYNHDAADFIEHFLPALPRNTLVYLDPPYFVKGQGLYENHYERDDHARIAHLSARIRQPWIISYDAAPEIVDLYKDRRSMRYDLSYSAQDRYSGSEIIVFSDNLIVPSVQHPAKVKAVIPAQPLL